MHYASVILLRTEYSLKQEFIDRYNFLATQLISADISAAGKAQAAQELAGLAQQFPSFTLASYYYSVKNYRAAYEHYRLYFNNRVLSGGVEDDRGRFEQGSSAEHIANTLPVENPDHQALFNVAKACYQLAIASGVRKYNAQQGIDGASVQAAYGLGRIYHQGLGLTPIDLSRATNTYIQAITFLAPESVNEYRQASAEELIKIADKILLSYGVGHFVRATEHYYNQSPTQQFSPDHFSTLYAILKNACEHSRYYRGYVKLMSQLGSFLQASNPDQFNYLSQDGSQLGFWVRAGFQNSESRTEVHFSRSIFKP